MRFLNKTFFKFTLGFLAIVALSLLVMYAASAYASGVEKIVFTTSAQTIKPGELSTAIKVQFQDSSNEAQSFGVTSKMVFESSSDTGEFLNESGNPVSATINSNWTGRTFYYRDSTEGNFLITVNVDGKDLSASQKITISSGAPEQSNNDDAEGEILGATDSGSVGQISGGGTTYVSSLNAQLEVSAGSDRVVAPGSPIWFQATLKKNTTKTNVELNWSFGDGFVATGPLVSHTYKYPGEYLVILNAKAGDIYSVSRLKVKVFEANILIEDGGEYLEIKNESNSEINLFNWRVESGGRGFIFQPNTIILPRATIKLDKNLLTMKGLDNSLGIVLKNSFGEEIFAVAPKPKIDTGEMAQNVENMKNQALLIQSKISKSGIAKSENIKTEAEFDEEKSEAKNEGSVIYEAPKSEGILNKLTKFIKGVFFR